MIELDPDLCFQALRARDPRFDGLFFVAVATTGIYCRPICPSRPVARRNCRFFRTPAQAERAGYRACFRCRPEVAPGGSPLESLSRLARRAAERIEGGALNEGSVDALAAELGVTGRHLRRAVEAELGVSPVELAQARRLALAKQLLHDTALPLTQVALAAGFGSVRRFNALFLSRFGRPPSQVRRASGSGEQADGLTIALRLDYRPPLDWEALLAFLSARAIPRVERVEGGAYWRTVALGEAAGTVVVRPLPATGTRRAALEARVSSSLLPRLPLLAARLRALFDLDARPDVIAAALARHPALRASVRRSPGLRVPGALSGFETAVRAILGQQVTVRGATTLTGRLVEALGEPLPGVEAPAAAKTGPGTGQPIDRLFPTPARLAGAPLEALRAIGLPQARAETLRALARSVAAGRLDLDSAAAPDATIERLLALPGVGPWTAGYLAMRALRSPDAFVAGDLGVRRALGVQTAAEAEARSQAFRPFRAYAAMHLWHGLAPGASSQQRQTTDPHHAEATDP